MVANLKLSTCKVLGQKSKYQLLGKKKWCRIFNDQLYWEKLRFQLSWIRHVNFLTLWCSLEIARIFMGDKNIKFRKIPCDKLLLIRHIYQQWWITCIITCKSIMWHISKNDLILCKTICKYDDLSIVYFIVCFNFNIIVI